LRKYLREYRPLGGEIVSRLRLLLLLVVFSCLSLPAFGLVVAGRVYWEFSYYPYGSDPGAGTYVKLCTNANGTGSCYQAAVSSSYPYTWNVDVPGNVTYYVFSWNDPYYWGSRDVVTQFTLSGQPTRYTGFYAQTGINWFLEIRSKPRPFPPNAIYPTNGATGVPLNMTLKWSNGSDLGRSGYQFVYDVYAYGDGGQELKILSNIPCNPDANGNCQYAITNLLSSTRYNWRVVAKLNPGVPTSGDPYYSQTSATFNFTTVTSSTAKYAFRTANQVHYMTANGCGGGAISATASSVGTCQQFEIVDANGGDIMHNDQVYIRINGYYLSANNGGGSTLNANVTWNSTWETFTIKKVSGTGRILNGHGVAFQALNGQYVYSQNAGGGDVWVMGPAIGNWEPFYITVQ
jgi:hypothetical protein